VSVLIYHHNDNDGYLSAAIIDMFLRQCETGEIEYAVGDYEGNYRIDMMEKAETIYILDYSLPNAIMDRYFDKIVWIDHHESAMRSLGVVESQHGKEFAGIREIGKSGALLTWEYCAHSRCADYFFVKPESFEQYWPGKKPPLVVELVNDRDVWAWKMGDDTAAFHEVSRMFMTNLYKWQALLKSDDQTGLEINYGYKLLSYIRDVVDTYIDSFSFKMDFFGFKAIVINGSAVMSGELHKRMREQNPDCKLAVVFTWTRNNQIKVSLYKNDDFTGKREANMYHLAQHFGGGGHKGAAGFYIEPSKWEEIIKNGKEGLL
jgi:uncharacterized protein